MNSDIASGKRCLTSKLIWIYAIISIFIVASVYLGGLLSTPTLCYCGGMLIPTVNAISFGSNGWVTFNIINPKGSDVPIFKIAEVMGRVNPSNYNYSVYVSVQPLYVIPEGVTAFLSIQFQGVTWQSGARYFFFLISSEGYRFAAFCGPSVCN